MIRPSVRPWHISPDYLHPPRRRSTRKHAGSESRAEKKRVRSAFEAGIEVYTDVHALERSLLAIPQSPFSSIYLYLDLPSSGLRSPLSWGKNPYHLNYHSLFEALDRQKRKESQTAPQEKKRKKAKEHKKVL